MAIAVVQSSKATGAAVSGVTTPALTTTTGNLFICDGSYYIGSGGFSSITDAKSNAYTDAIAEVSAAASSLSRYKQKYKENGAGGASHTFTLTMTTSDAYPSFHVKEVSGAATSGALDKTATKNNNSGTTGMTSTAAAATAQADELLAGACAWSDDSGTTSYTPQSGFTQDQNYPNIAGSQQGLLTASKVVSAISTYAFTYDCLPDVAMTGNIGAISTWKAAAAAAQWMTKPKIFLQAAHRVASW